MDSNFKVGFSLFIQIRKKRRPQLLYKTIQFFGNNWVGHEKRPTNWSAVRIWETQQDRCHIRRHHESFFKASLTKKGHRHDAAPAANFALLCRACCLCAACVLCPNWNFGLLKCALQLCVRQGTWTIWLTVNLPRITESIFCDLKKYEHRILAVQLAHHLLKVESSSYFELRMEKSYK